MPIVYAKPSVGSNYYKAVTYPGTEGFNCWQVVNNWCTTKKHNDSNAIVKAHIENQEAEFFESIFDISKGSVTLKSNVTPRAEVKYSGYCIDPNYNSLEQQHQFTYVGR